MFCRAVMWRFDFCAHFYPNIYQVNTGGRIEIVAEMVGIPTRLPDKKDCLAWSPCFWHARKIAEVGAHALQMPWTCCLVVRNGFEVVWDGNGKESMSAFFLRPVLSEKWLGILEVLTSCGNSPSWVFHTSTGHQMMSLSTGIDCMVGFTVGTVYPILSISLFFLHRPSTVLVLTFTPKILEPPLPLGDFRLPSHILFTFEMVDHSTLPARYGLRKQE